MLDMGIRIEQARYKVIEILTKNCQWGYISGIDEWLSDDIIKGLLENEEEEFVASFCATHNREIELIVAFKNGEPVISERVVSGDKGWGACYNED